MTAEFHPAPGSQVKRKRGPEPLPASAHRKKRLNVFFNEEEYAFIKAQGGARPSEYVRVMALFGEPTPQPFAVPELNQLAWAELAKTAANLNQIAYRLNTNQAVDFNEVREVFTQFRKSLVKAELKK